MTAPEFDLGQLVALLRHAPSICTSCVAIKFTLSLEQVLDAVIDLSQTIVIEQGLRRCPVCGRTEWVLSVTPIAEP